MFARFALVSVLAAAVAALAAAAARLKPFDSCASLVGYARRAFLYWPADRLAVLPVEQAAAGFRVARQGIDARGSVSQPGMITRSAAIGDRPFTVSESGVTASPLSTLRGGAWLPFTQGAP